MPAVLEERERRAAWGWPLSYERRGARGYEVRSAGPDGAAGAPDNLVGVYAGPPLLRERQSDCRS